LKEVILIKFKSIFLIVIAILLCISLFACQNAISKDDAKETTEAFILALEKGDFEKAKTYLHPERPFDVEKYLNGIEERTGVDFQKGIEIKRYTEFSSSLYESEVDGADYELEMNIVVDGVAFELSVDIVKNDLGYGIYDFEIDK
jgi:hypothetical protein